MVYWTPIPTPPHQFTSQRILDLLQTPNLSAEDRKHVLEPKLLFPPSTCSQPTPNLTLKLKAPIRMQTESCVIIPAPCLCCTSLLLLPQQQDCSPQLLPRKHWAPRITTASPASYTCVVTLPNTPHTHQGLPRIEIAKKMPHISKGRLMIDTKTKWLEERGFSAF